MANKKVTRRALAMSVVALILCCAMLVGTTFAWFTDSASSAVNTIQSGNLDVDLVDAEGNTVVGQSLKFVNANGETEILWEPGCTFKLPAVYVKNNGNLALKYQIAITGINGNAKLLEVIDWTILNKGATTTSGNLTAGERSGEIVIQAHMRENAGNEYQDLKIEGIGITVVATQDTVEFDSYDNQYDKDAVLPTIPDADVLPDGMPQANVKELPLDKTTMYIIPNISEGFGGGQNQMIDPHTAFQFVAQDDETSVQESPYKDWLVDYYVSIDKPVEEGLVLFGCYDSWESGAWYGFNVPADDYSEPVGLLGVMTGGISNWTYEGIVTGVNTFSCGAADTNGKNAGSTMTVMLRLINPEDTTEFYNVATVNYTF